MSKLTEEREREIRAMLTRFDVRPVPWAHVDELLAALDATRTELAEARAEVERWKAAVGDAGFRHQADNYHVVDFSCLEGLIESNSSNEEWALGLLEERDQARRDAVELHDALCGGGDQCPYCRSVAAYRAALRESPDLPGGTSDSTKASEPPTEAGGNT